MADDKWRMGQAVLTKLACLVGQFMLIKLIFSLLGRAVSANKTNI